MRLSKIKLAGFKSFVDPTTIPFPSSLVGVVGPNGCGKSNVVDAVRWVMGESSASRLRGDSITDVIFNGSSSRKPVGAASVELLFDNTDTTLTGEYSKYSEISIRREVARDGISTYYLNGTKCRRKDVTGVFLGTGLGPRSYSIIEQGMISRIIEAKPEEMRVFIEEAAGVSKYKERRRETSNRIKHTKDNLDRLTDVIDEVEKHIKHLNRQAKTAERYSSYKDEERRAEAQSLALRLRDLDARGLLSDRSKGQSETALEAVVAVQRNIEAKVERARIEHRDRTDELNEIQGRFYKAGSQIARLEQSIKHAYELRERQKEDLTVAVRGATEISEHINKDETAISQLELTLNELVPGLEEAQKRQEDTQEALEAAEQTLAKWQRSWKHYTDRLNVAENTRDVEKTRSEQLRSRIKSLETRSQKLNESKKGADPKKLKDDFEGLSIQEQSKRQARDEFDRHLADLHDKIQKLREQDSHLNEIVEKHSMTLLEAQSRYVALEAIQKAALGQSDESIESWLMSSQLGDAKRVAQLIDVKEGWETAVEMVLGDYLQAVCVDDIKKATESLDKFSIGKVTVLSGAVSGVSNDNEPDTLASKVSGAPAALLEVLSSTRTAKTLKEALEIRDQLQDGSVITSDGVWLSTDWLRVARDRKEEEGILDRENEIRVLHDEILEMKDRRNKSRELAETGRARLGQLEDSREKMQVDSGALVEEYADLKARLDGTRFKYEQAEARQEAIREEVASIDTEHRAAEEQSKHSQSQFSGALEALDKLEIERKSLELDRDRIKGELEGVRAKAEQDRLSAQDLAIKFETRKSTRDSATQSLERMQSQLDHFTSRERYIRQQIDQGDAPLANNKIELERQLGIKVEVEKKLSKARDRVEEVEGKLSLMDQDRLLNDRAVEEARAAVSEANMAAQEISVRREGLAEQFEHTGFDLKQMLAEIEDGSTVEQWDERLEKIRRKIERLGPINLAAIDEFKEQSERKEYLDSQFADVQAALASLEAAIRKIDRETRTRFRDTFEYIDSGFKRLFPKLFGGGHAYLELTGDDLLSAGVTVMAQPPGKRNSTIHLLSGGEKALTAVALVFAIFELNPAPYCLLDEVDAPLDDANVARFCEIVKEMSNVVQFVFITHNKVTMEMARQLTGVTMQEPGVSRLVSVDIDAAVKMAAS
ncbi:MAG: chromosome segregation protein SMC [Woeseia sp.]|nr:chromosome segregation protein SMC [Woeseia sp.]